MRKNCKTFEQWIESMYQDFLRTEKRSCNLHYTIYSRGNTVCCIISSIRTGWSACQRVKLENHNLIPEARRKAIALAWASYKGEDIPYFKKLVSLRDIENGAVFEDSDGIAYIKIGYNPHSNAYTCINYYGANCYIECKGSEKVYPAS